VTSRLPSRATSLAFWVDDAEGIAQQAINVVIGLSTYPSTIFRGAVKLALFSVIPAGFIGFVPVQAIRSHELPWLAAHLAASATFLALGSWVFALGLRRHASGSMFVARV
jgi:ABC-2 type transport system permease protein